MRIQIDANGCWIWQNRPNRAGYGQVGIHGRHLRAHRAVYELLVGPIPAGYEVHHLCRVRSCVNPEHLEARQMIWHRRYHNVQHECCVWGHPFDEANTYIRSNGERQCRKCKARRERERQRRLRDHSATRTKTTAAS